MKHLMSGDNFIKIFYDENRKGIPLEYKFPQELGHIKELSQKILKCDKNKDYNSKYLLIKKRSELINKTFQHIGLEVSNNPVNIRIKKSEQKIKNKDVYCIDGEPNKLFAFLVLKQIQYNLKFAFKIKLSNRDCIIKQFINMACNKIPKFILRTDIKSFFETISHIKLKNIIDKNYRLDYYSREIIFKILDQYEKISNQNKGIPRGIGISSYLAEVYMKDFDSSIKYLDDVIYYARFVDDIVIISLSDISEQLEQICKKYDLMINGEKNKLIQINENINGYIDYLGYEINMNGNIDINKKKQKNIIAKIKITFETYEKESKYNDKRAWKDLCNRLKFLTANTRLVNVKKKILVGSYFSNALLHNNMKYKVLDRVLLCYVNNLKIYDRIKHRNIDKMKEYLKRFLFQAGFVDKNFIVLLHQK